MLTALRPRSWGEDPAVPPGQALGSPDQAGPRAWRFHAGRSFERCFGWGGGERETRTWPGSGVCPCPLPPSRWLRWWVRIDPGDSQTLGVFCWENV